MTLFRIAVLIGIVTFLLFTVLFMPASIVWYLLSERIAPQMLSLSEISGTPWRGRAVAAGKFIPTGEVAWNLSETALVTGVLQADLVLDSPSHHITGTVIYTADRLELQHASGWVDATAVNQKVEPLGYQVSGSLTIDDLNARAEGRWLTQLHGALEWSGGKLAYTSAFSNLLYHLPALTGSLDLDGGAIASTVREKAGEAALFDFRLQQDGWARISMYGRLFDLVQQPWPMQGAPDDVVMDLESQLWQ